MKNNYAEYGNVLCYSPKNVSMKIPHYPPIAQLLDTQLVTCFLRVFAVGRWPMASGVSARWIERKYPTTIYLIAQAASVAKHYFIEQPAVWWERQAFSGKISQLNKKIRERGMTRFLQFEK